MARSLVATEEAAVSDRRVRAYIGLGANVGDAEATLVAAVSRAVGAAVQSASVPCRACTRPSRSASSTSPSSGTRSWQSTHRPARIGRPAPSTLLAQLKGLERRFGRQDRGRWGPRELDLDLLVFGRARIAVERPAAARSIDAELDPAKASKLLEVPHREAAVRLFVLAPLADLAPGLVPPGWGCSVETARRRQAKVEGPGAMRVVGVWDATRRRWRASNGS